MNKTFITGNIGRDAVLEYSKIGEKKFIKFSVGVWQPGEEGKTTLWFEVIYFGDRAEKIVNRAVKGNSVAVTGRITLEKWTKENVEKTTLKIIADEVQVFTKAPQASQAQTQSESTKEKISDITEAFEQ